jgi:hypothetical protein
MAITKVTSALTDLDGGITIDNITIDGTEIDLSSGDLTIDVAGDIILDADAGVWRFKDAGTTLFQIAKDGQSLVLYSGTSDGDMLFKGNDGGSTVTALTLDMSEAGKATFNSDIVFGGTGTITSATNSLKALNTGDNGFLIRSAVSSAANPSYSNVDDTNTGMFLPGSDVAAFTTGGAERMRIDSSGGVRINNTSTQDTKLFVEYNTASTNVGAAIISNPNASASRVLTVNIGSNSTLIAFDKSFAGVGSISTNGSSVSYNTSSDYRLKENVDYTWDATTRLKQLKPARFNFISDETNTLVDGFLAHEVQDIVPEAISGEKDAVDSEGNPEYQGIDQSKLVPLLVKTIQELEARITTLEG